MPKLSPLQVQRERRPGLHGDGGGLYLKVTRTGGRSWVYRYMLAGKAHWMGLGPLSLYGLREAREKALDARRLAYEGTDPIEHRTHQRARQRLDEARAITFDACTAAYIEAHRAGWKHPKHLAQWRSSMATYGSPVIGELPVAAIDTGLVLRVLEPMWAGKTETGRRVRSRIEAVLDWARVRGYREGENPARWKGHLAKLLAAPAKVARVEHFPAMPYSDVPTFVAQIRAANTIDARALEFCILTAARTQEVLGMTWDEVDTSAKLAPVWTIPAARMKGGKEHRVPLSPRAVEILAERWERRIGRFVFCRRPHKPLGHSSLQGVLARAGITSATVHGFRSSFRDWAAERTAFSHDVIEAALAHTVGSSTERSYRRTDLLDRRRKLLDAWCAYCSGPARGDVVAIRG